MIPVRTQNLPSFATSFIGRQAELAEIEGLLVEPKCRLLTLIGAGGMGKTRLAVEAATQQADCFPDGICFVALQMVDTADRMTSTIIDALNLQRFDVAMKAEQQQLADYLSNKVLLLILDNFEQVIEGAELVAELLNAAPYIKIIVTSRLALNIQHEWVRPVAGMTFPDAGNELDFQQYSAIQLFIDRAQPTSSSFDAEREMPHIIQICQLVGGMPLGIELAAAWLRSLSCAEIAQEIQQSMDILETQKRDVPERHRSVRAVFDTSWKSLTADEQALFMRLSIFQRTPTREAIQEIMGVSLPMLSALVEKALLTRAPENRYHLHELLRQYGEEKLAQSMLATETRDAHSHYYLNFVRDQERDLWGRRQIQAMEEIEADFDNVRAAWYWALERMDEDSISNSVEPLCLFMWMRWGWGDGQHMITEAQQRFAPKQGEKPRLVWAKLLSRWSRNADDSIAQVKQALAIAQHYEDAAEMAMCYYQLGQFYSFDREFELSNEYLMQSLEYFREVDDPFHEAGILNRIGTVYRLTGDYELALHYTQEAMRIARDLGDTHYLGFACGEMALLLFIQGNFAEAERLHAEAGQLAQHSNYWLSIWIALESAGLFDLGVRGNIQQARQTVETTLIRQDFFKIEVTQSLGIAYRSLLVAMDEDYREAHEIGKGAYLLFEDDAWGPSYRWGVMAAAAGMGDYASLDEHNQILLRHFYKVRVNTWLLVGVVFAAILATYRDNDPKRGTELLALASTHPHSLQGWLGAWAYIQRLKQHLENTLGSSAFAATWEHGSAMNLDKVVQELLAETSITSPIQDANSSLIDPLSERELEVLGLIAAGYSNREIADQLVVGEATVKKHITHIYSKLDVDSRTKALNRARELQIV